MRAAGDAEAKERVRAQTAMAIAEGAFGVPTLVVDGELFWGFDAFEAIDARLRGDDPIDDAALLRWRDLEASSVRRAVRPAAPVALGPEALRARAVDWIDAWNRRDLEAILAHYADDVAVCSPRVAERLGAADGWLRGKAALRDYFARGLRNAALRFELVDVALGVGAMTVIYRRENGALVTDCAQSSTPRGASFAWSPATVRRADPAQPSRVGRGGRHAARALLYSAHEGRAASP